MLQHVKKLIIWHLAADVEWRLSHLNIYYGSNMLNSDFNLDVDISSKDIFANCSCPLDMKIDFISDLFKMGSYWTLYNSIIHQKYLLMGLWSWLLIH